MKNLKLLFFCFINLSAYSQTILISETSFQKLYDKDFSALVGQEGLAINQIIVGINKPKIEISQVYKIFTIRRFQIPLFTINPYVKGNLNSDGNLDVFKGDKVNSELSYGAKLIINPFGMKYGFNSPTGYFFNQSDGALLTTRRTAINTIVQDIMALTNKLAAFGAFAGLSNEDKNKFLDTQEKLNELNLIALNPKKSKKYMEDKLYEVEKDAKWNSKHYFFISFNFNRGVKNAKFFQNNTFTSDLLDNYSVNGTPTFNYTCVSMKRGFTFNAFLSFDKLKTNSIFDATAKDFVESKQIAGGNNLSSFEKKETAYDLTDITVKKELTYKKTYKVGATILVEKLKNSGFNTEWERNQTDNVWNTKFALVLPNIKKESGKTSQANFQIVASFKDFYNQSEKNKINTPTWRQKAIISIQLGLPI